MRETPEGEARESRRCGARLFALDLRLEELAREVRTAQVRVHHLEAALEDARLSGLFGEASGDAGALEPELERSRGRLESWLRLLDQVRASRRQARVDYALSRLRERRAAAGEEA
jgi:hypothetical protein